LEAQEDGAISANAHFSVGDLVHHKLFDYRGVIVDVDSRLMLSDEWYETVAHTRPPKDQPWYRVLVHDAKHETYVAERNLEPDTSGAPVRHPLIETRFSSFSDGRYLTAGRMN
jgi:heat shock protein HspQ